MKQVMNRSASCNSCPFWIDQDDDGATGECAATLDRRLTRKYDFCAFHPEALTEVPEQG